PATLYIVSEPFGAEIAVNGQSTGLKTPESVDGLAPGRTYKVTLTRKGYQTWEEDVEVVGGGPKHVSARLIPGGRKRK
ncbi:MAG TPA: PEGA domain-containing protein, partial [Polyangia bacterium]